MTKEKESKLTEKLPEWAIKPHPTKNYLSVINPMAVIDRLNEVFGVGQWQYYTEPVNFVGKFAVVKGTLKIPSEDIHIEQFGGNDNTDVGDAYKGASTDALTKIASYLGIGASIYKNMGNVDAPKEYTLEEALHLVAGATSVTDLTTRYKTLPAYLQKDEEIIAKCKEVKEDLEAFKV